MNGVAGVAEFPDVLYRLDKVGRTYRRGDAAILALTDVDLTIRGGEFLTIQGPTGQGKTTLLQLLGGLDRPTSGTVTFEGQDIGSMREARLTDVRARSFGFVFQGFNLIPTLSARENVETALVPLGVHGAQRERRAADALADVGLADRAGHVPSELSGGEQQRVAIARALVGAPRVILADEPTGNLDESTRDDIIGLLERLWSERGQTLVIVTHDSGIARRAPRTAWIQEGRLTLREAGAAEAATPVEPTAGPPAGGAG
jgi:putative ABC transport system ATP-binding protein